jgi:hypothetical protein
VLYSWSGRVIDFSSCSSEFSHRRNYIYPTRNSRECPLSGVKRTSLPHRKMSANDPKRTSAVFPQLAALARAMGRYHCPNL